jgi:hypothetical protein
MGGTAKARDASNYENKIAYLCLSGKSFSCKQKVIAV